VTARRINSRFMEVEFESGPALANQLAKVGNTRF
jgi:hypothetical protein